MHFLLYISAQIVAGALLVTYAAIVEGAALARYEPVPGRAHIAGGMGAGLILAALFGLGVTL